MTKKPWSGRFTSPTLEAVETFTESVSIDCRLYKHDIAGSIAHAKMLSRAGILDKQELKAIVDGLTSIKADIASGKFVFDKKLEDVHMNIETELVKRIGPVGKKLHTARSRNDQVATDFRLYLKDEVIFIKKDLKGLMNAFVDKAKDSVDIIMPGFTHLQHAQPVSFSHHMLAYFEMFLRDYERFSDLTKRTNISPLGSAALAGTPYPIDRDITTAELGFDMACRNSIDGVSDRDFAIEFVFASSVTMMHLSRLVEELIMWNSQEFSFIDLPDAYCTGSSIMPQKKNPDVLELIRGKVGSVYGNLISLLTLMKGLPLAYNRDMQEDKAPAINTADTLKRCIEMTTGIINAMGINKDAMEEALKKGFITATDVADYLAKKGVPFRDAHRITGELVALLIKEKKSIDDLNLKDFKKFSPKFEKDILSCIDPKNSVDARTSFGGTARKNVNKAIKNAYSIIEGLD
jgi:argininosuccinate lyase